MKKTKIEDMKVKITYSDKKINKKKLYSIFCDIIIRDIENRENEKEGNIRRK